MAVPIIMPRQGQSVESCVILKWNKSKGDRVAVGDILFSYETDKASFEEEARNEGVLLDIFFDEGEDVPCLTNVCVIGNTGENTEEFNPKVRNITVENKTVQSAGEKQENAVEQASVTASKITAISDEKVRISPRAKNLAEKIGVDYRYASPTGPNGRIIERDIAVLRENGPVVTAAARDEYQKSGFEAVSGTGLGGRITTNDLKAAVSTISQNVYKEIKLTNIRKVIARAMHNSISCTAQLTLNSSFDATEILAYRKKLKEGKDAPGFENITINDILLYTVSRTLPNHESLNAHFLEDKMLVFNNVHLGVAVDTERGLMVPTLFDANLKSLNEISKEIKKLAEDCQKGTIKPDMLKGASFTLTNLGTLDIESFTPILNPPQTGILGINNIIYRMKPANDGFINYPAMGLSLTFDHRALDGAPAARFLKDLKNNLENFSKML